MSSLTITRYVVACVDYVDSSHEVHVEAYASLDLAKTAVDEVLELLNGDVEGGVELAKPEWTANEDETIWTWGDPDDFMYTIHKTVVKITLGLKE